MTCFTCDILYHTDFKSTYLPHTVCQQSEALNVDPVKKKQIEKGQRGCLDIDSTPPLLREMSYFTLTKCSRLLNK